MDRQICFGATEKIRCGVGSKRTVKHNNNNNNLN